ncbi:MAG: transporter ATP-binding protein [Cyanobacteriota bacterium]
MNFSSTSAKKEELQSLLKVLNLSQNQGQIPAHLIELLEPIAFQLGDLITTVPVDYQSNGHGSSSHSDLYLVCQGRVRLLTFNTAKQQMLSVQLCQEGSTFGGDERWQVPTFPYQAIAASPVQVIKFSPEALIGWLDLFPDFDHRWNQGAQERQLFVFLKSLTPLGNVSSQRLQQLLPMIHAQTIPAGESLALESGHFWLRQGQISGQDPAQMMGIGAEWGYPEPVPADWTAQSDLDVYYIQPEDWQTATAIAPILEGHDAEARESRPLAPQGKTVPPVMTPPANSSRLAAPPPLPPPPQNQAIAFPRPLKRRRGLWQHYPFIEQQSAADCGAACLAMLSQYWGKRLSLNFLRTLTGVGRSGATLKNLARAAESIGYQARPVRASLNRLMDQKNPWIAHWQGDHYVLVYGVRGDRLLVADPAQGKRLMPSQEFVAGWTGYALLLDPTERLKQIPTEKRSLGRFVKLLLPYKTLGIQVILASFLIQVFGLVSPLFTQIILDKVVVNKSLSTLNVFAVGILLFGIWGILLSGIRQYLLSYLANRLDLTMIGGFIRHTLLLPLQFFESRHVGDILTRVNENEKIQRFLLNQVVLAWLDFLMGFVYLGLMLYYNWKLTLLIVGLIPPIMLLTLGATPLLRRVSRDIFNRSAEQNSALVETISGIPTVKATATERELRWRWEDRLTSYLNSRFRGQKLGINLQAASGLINAVGSAALLWYGATLVIQDQLTIGQFVAFNMMIGRVISPVLSLADLWDELQEVLISVERLDDIFSAQPEETPGEPMLVLPTIRGDVRFENVTFRYDKDDDRNTLQNISFSVQAGQTIAIVGRSGSGKTTLVKLLQAMYYPESGTIWIDDHDIRHVSPHSLRAQLGVVPQDCFLFSGTILENITLYRPEFSLDQAIEAAKLAESHAFIQAMPLGYNTKVGERGANLSGGQRQRLAIARALIGTPRILVLDEATSSLDAESERRFQENLTRLSRDRTTFIIAHRLSTVRNADCILVLDQGVLVERGTHGELMGQQGLYCHLAQQQLDL